MQTNLMELIQKRYFESSRRPIFEHFLKPELTALSEGESTIKMNIGDEHLNAQRMIHGGVLAAVADLAMGVACITYDRQVVTTDMHTMYIGNVGVGSTIKAVANVIHNGKTLIRAICHIYDENGRLLVSAHGTYFVIGELHKDLDTHLSGL